MTHRTSWAGRVVAFIGEMYPVFPVQIAVFGGFALNYTALAHWFYGRPVRWDELILGGLTLVTLSFLLRVYDELKDYESDQVNFPDRPLVRGVATPEDMRILIPVLHVMVLAFNVPFVGRLAFLVFAGLTGFCYLMYRWFFMEKLIRPSLPLAFFTHHPVVPIMQFYALSFFRDSGAGFPFAAILFLVSTGLYATVWEIGRKIRGTSEETEYNTYSKVWGPRFTVILLLTVCGISIVCGLAATWDRVTPQWLLAAWALPLAAVGRLKWVALPFLKNPSKAPKIGFKTLSEGFALALLVGVLILLVADAWI